MCMRRGVGVYGEGGGVYAGRGGWGGRLLVAPFSEQVDIAFVLVESQSCQQIECDTSGTDQRFVLPGRLGWGWVAGGGLVVDEVKRGGPNREILKSGIIL